MQGQISESDIFLVASSEGNITTGSGNATVTLPSGIKDGDFVLFHFGADTTANWDTSTLVQTSNWETFQSWNGGSSKPATQNACKFIADASAETSILVDKDGSFTIQWICSVWRNVDPVDYGEEFIGADATTQKTLADAIPNGPSITTNTDKAVVISTFINKAGWSSPPPTLAGYTLVEYANYTGDMAQAYKQVDVAGSENPGTWGQTTAGKHWILTIALRRA